MAVSALISPALSKVPASFHSGGGDIAFDEEYFYIKYNGWRRFPLCTTSNLANTLPRPSVKGHYLTDNNYFYIVVGNKWKRSPEFVIKPKRPIYPPEVHPIPIESAKLTTFPRGTDNYGRWGLIAFNAEYFCVWGQGKWHKIPIGKMSAIYTKDVSDSLVPRRFPTLTAIQL